MECIFHVDRCRCIFVGILLLRCSPSVREFTTKAQTHNNVASQWYQYWRTKSAGVEEMEYWKSNCVDNNINNKGARLLTLRQKRGLGRVTSTCCRYDSSGGNAQNRYSGELSGAVRIAINVDSALLNASLKMVWLELTIYTLWSRLVRNYWHQC